MKIRMTVTVEVDAEDWSQEYGIHPGEVRDDVRSYFANQVFQSAAVEDAGLTVTVRS
jgi:hypothetical protein